MSAPNSASGQAGRVTPERVKSDPEALTLIRMADRYMDAIGYTDHGFEHVARVAKRSADILRQLEYPERDAELAEIAGLLHDIGNVVHRDGHPQASALMALPLLGRMGMAVEEAAIVASAIGNHDEGNGQPVSAPCAALIIGDKTDVLRSRVRNPVMVKFDIHDRVNYASQSSELIVEKDQRRITLQLTIDTTISTVMEYFEIFLSRMAITRKAANYLNCDFHLVINEVRLT
ncbi:MAG: HD domain protein [candidate division BRC1 bacterium ADurb.BinA364]|nr:MAG: HD domain protein [candidate division BRC1 bacterium ADurb.BinA364]